MIQFLYKKKDKFNAKLRRRKFKSRVYNKTIISNASYNRTISPYPWLVGLRVKHACRVKFKTFIGAQKALMFTKNKVRLHFNKYPNFFVTKKSSKSRMGKGKGKIVGRILKVHKGETIFNIRPKNITKTRKHVRAIKGTIPSKSSLINSSWGAKKFYFNFYRYRLRTYVNWRGKRKKKPFWMKVRKIYRPEYQAEKEFVRKIFLKRKFIRYLTGAWPKVRRKRQRIPKMWACTGRPVRMATRRLFRHNAFAPYKVSGICYHRKRRPLKRPTNARPGDGKKCAGGAWKRFYFIREDTMVHVIKNLRLDIFLPDERGDTGMAKFLNYMQRTEEERRARHGIVRPKISYKILSLMPRK